MRWDAAGSTVLVTGAQGFIGSWLAQRLLAEGAAVVVPRRDFDPQSRFRTDGIEDRCRVVLADIQDYESMVRVLNEHEVDTVFHLAAQTIVGTANRSPLSTFDANIRGTYALRACIVNFNTRAEDVDALPAIVVEIARDVEREMGPGPTL